jgi:beta-glucanase (GH16 family)
MLALAPIVACSGGGGGAANPTSAGASAAVGSTTPSPGAAGAAGAAGPSPSTGGATTTPAATTPASGSSTSPSSSSSCPGGTSTTIDPNNLACTAHLTFDEEFNNLSIWNGNTGIWDTTPPYVATNANGSTLSNNGEQEWYINANYGPTQSIVPWTVSNGILSITANVAPASIQPDINNYQYTSGVLNTSQSFNQQYGYFAMRAKLPAGQGFWPAFWLLPQNGGWPPEIDIMEVLGNAPTTLYTTVHYNSDNESQGQATTVPDTSADFHVYAVDWEADYITWYFDGQQVFKVATPPGLNTPMYIIMNLAVGGNWPGDVNSTTPFPSSMQVDWVRAYASGPGS